MVRFSIFDMSGCHKTIFFELFAPLTLHWVVEFLEKVTIFIFIIYKGVFRSIVEKIYEEAIATLGNVRMFFEKINEQITYFLSV